MSLETKKLKLRLWLRWKGSDQRRPGASLIDAECQARRLRLVPRQADFRYRLAEPTVRTDLIPVVSVLPLNRDHTVLRIGVVNLLLNSQTFGKLFRIVASRVGRRSHRQTEERRHKKQRWRTNAFHLACLPSRCLGSPRQPAYEIRTTWPAMAIQLWFFASLIFD